MADFPDFKPMELKDKPLFDGFFSRHPPQISEMTFTNLFCWRHSRRHEFAVYKGHLLISFSDSGVRSFYQPAGPDSAKIIAEIVGMFPESTFQRVEKGIAEKLKDTLDVRGDRSMADYEYKVSDLADMPGDRYSQKRNFVRRFSAYCPTTCNLDVHTAKDFLGMQERWCDIRNCAADSELAAENMAVNECLNNFAALGVHGICVRVNGKMEAFAIGEKLNRDTFVEHFEKANAELKGIYQYTLKEFAHSIPRSVEFLNREQDLGVEGLRKAKLSYHPSSLVEKFSISK